MIYPSAGTYADNVRITAETNYSVYWRGGLAAQGGGTTSSTWIDNPSTTDRTQASWVAAGGDGGDDSSQYYQLWTGGCNAIFQGVTAGTVAVSGTIGSVNAITFATDGYTLSDAGSIITMTGAGGNITTGAGTDEIDSAIAGGVGLTKNGAGTLVLGRRQQLRRGYHDQAGTLKGQPHRIEFVQ